MTSDRMLDAVEHLLDEREALRGQVAQLTKTMLRVARQLDELSAAVPVAAERFRALSEALRSDAT